VTIHWSPGARASARRYMADQEGMRAIGAAVASLADDPLPAEGFHAGSGGAQAACDQHAACVAHACFLVQPGGGSHTTEDTARATHFGGG
jgi:hypothetical protein